MFDYIREPDAIYAASFKEIRAVADLSVVPAELHPLAVRVVHACGDVGVIEDLACSPGAVEAGQRALFWGAPVLVDVRMLAQGIIARALPAKNRIVCTIDDAGVVEEAKRQGITRSAKALDRWGPHLGGAVVVIGNAPTALFRLLEGLGEGWPRPALILGFPVGFVGATESKDALIAHAGSVPYVTLRGRRGGSAIAAAAFNALTIGVR
ncbi:precorrin-8X methylmutase [Varunaivibrio sulfuroxidans]|uniref:precorrin-8X methylmutase n=1 Tax=Varunaivibrio sulfuroxidans TaxID=1773489 RepID=UPI001051A957|nr:precorrin-8X methylmutase [Varunaivibrio sulfuroxidans]